MSVGVVTDSTAALPEAVRSQWGIGLVPLAITVDGRTVDDGELGTAEILAARTHSSASPSPGAFVQGISDHDQGDGVAAGHLQIHVAHRVHAPAVSRSDSWTLGSAVNAFAVAKSANRTMTLRPRPWPVVCSQRPPRARTSPPKSFTASAAKWTCFS